MGRENEGCSNSGTIGDMSTSKQGNQSLRSTYQAIREQLIHLSIELEEKNNVANILTNKIENERLLLSKIEVDITNEYQHVVDEITRDNKVAIDSIMKKTSQSMPNTNRSDITHNR